MRCAATFQGRRRPHTSAPSLLSMSRVVAGAGGVTRSVSLMTASAYGNCVHACRSGGAKKCCALSARQGAQGQAGRAGGAPTKRALAAPHRTLSSRRMGVPGGPCASASRTRRASTSGCCAHVTSTTHALSVLVPRRTHANGARSRLRGKHELHASQPRQRVAAPTAPRDKRRTTPAAPWRGGRWQRRACWPSSRCLHAERTEQQFGFGCLSHGPKIRARKTTPP